MYICHCIVILSAAYFYRPVLNMLNELEILFGNGKEHLIIPAHVISQSFGRGGLTIMMLQACGHSI